MKKQASPQLTAAILEAVNNQLSENEPLETRETYMRLIKAGYSDEEAKRLIGAILSTEIFEVLKEKKEYNRERYVKNLKNLPAMPWEDWLL